MDERFIIFDLNYTGSEVKFIWSHFAHAQETEGHIVDEFADLYHWLYIKMIQS